MRFGRLFSVAAAIVFTVPLARAQFTPLVARMRQSTETTKAGKVIRKTLKEGYYYRSSYGSVERRWTSLNGTKMNSLRSSFWDNRSLTHYALDFPNKQAIFQGQEGSPATPELDPNNLNAMQKWPEDALHGVLCRVVPAKVQLGGKVIQAGKGWYSVQYNFLVKDDITYPIAGGSVVHDVYELYDIHVGQEPSAAVFGIPKDFQVLRPQPRK